MSVTIASDLIGNRPGVEAAVRMKFEYVIQLVNIRLMKNKMNFAFSHRRNFQTNPSKAMTITADNEIHRELFQSVWNDDKASLQRLLRNDSNLANVEINAVSKWTPLMFCAMNGRLKCMKILIRCGASLQQKDSAGRTVLHWAACHGFLNIVKYLIEECNIDSMCTTKKGYTAADLSRRSCFTNVYNYLITSSNNGMNIIP